MAHIENHTLYMTNTCPYCIRVLRFMEDAGITMEMRNIAQPENSAELVAIGGKRQVPCLVIDGKAMYESADIIAYLKKNYA